MSDRDDAIEQRFHFVQSQCQHPRPGPAGILCRLDSNHPGDHEIPIHQLRWPR